MLSTADGIGSAGVGPLVNMSMRDRAVSAAEYLFANEEIDSSWVRPLVLAIKRDRLLLPTLSPTTAKIVRLIETPDVALDDLSCAVMSDPGLATRVMGVANSSYFRGVEEVPNVHEALMRMGLREARTIIIVVALKSTVLSGAMAGPYSMKLWKHSILTASAAQEVCAKLAPWEHVGMLAGLVHDLGKLVLLSFVQEEEPVWQEASGQGPSAEAIELMMGPTHASLGALMLSSWGFPSSFCEGVLAHEAPHEAQSPHASNSSRVSEPPGEFSGKDARNLASALHLANTIAHEIDEGWPATLDALPEDLIEEAESLGFSPERLIEIAEDASASFEYLSRVG